MDWKSIWRKNLKIVGSLFTGLILVVLTCLPADAFEPQKIMPPILKVPVYFATDRAVMTSNQNDDGHKLSTFKVGKGTVYIPLDKRWASSAGLSDPLIKIGCEIDTQRSTLSPYIEPRGYVAEPDEKLFLADVAESDIWPSLIEKASSVKKVYVYIHGFASSGNNALYTVGILAPNLEAPVVAFTWPSKGTAGLKFGRIFKDGLTSDLYERDKKMIDDPQVLVDLSNFLKDLRRRVPADVQINLIAHSLGNRLLSKYFISDSNEIFDNTYFLSADVDSDLFEHVTKKLNSRSKNTFVYFNPSDKVLKASFIHNAMNLKFTKKLGNKGFPVSGIQFVNYNKIAKPDTLEFKGLKHYVPFDRLGNMIRTGSPSPSEDTGEFFSYRNVTIEKRKVK